MKIVQIHPVQLEIKAYPLFFVIHEQAHFHIKQENEIQSDIIIQKTSGKALLMPGVNRPTYVGLIQDSYFHTVVQNIISEVLMFQ